MWSRLPWLRSPVLSRGFNDTLEVVTRACCFIVDNICKFVEYLAVMIPMMCEFDPFVNAAHEQVLSASIPNEMNHRIGVQYTSTLNWHVQ